MRGTTAMLKPGAKTDWQTPQKILDLVRAFNGGPIGLDPGTSPDNPTDAIDFYTRETDGLARSWDAYGLVYVNPEYGPAIVPWVEKCATEGARGVEIIALLPARTDTKWWQAYVSTSTRVCFWRGRLRFIGAPAPAPFPSAIAYWGIRPIDFEEIFYGYGCIMRRS